MIMLQPYEKLFFDMYIYIYDDLHPTYNELY